MPRNRKLTWQPGADGRPGRWKKKYKGRAYYFSGGRGKTDQAAYDKALEDWEKKKREVDAETPKPHQEDYEATINEWQHVLGWSRKNGDDEMAEVASAKLAKLSRQFGAPRPTPITTEDKFDAQFDLAVRNPELYEAINFVADNFQPIPVAMDEVAAAVAKVETDLRHSLPHEPVVIPISELSLTDSLEIESEIWRDRLNVLQRSNEESETDLQSHIDRFLASKRATVSAGRADMLRRYLGKFTEWSKNDSDVADLAGTTLIDYHEYLVGQVRSNSLPAGTARECLGAVKTFIRWLWQKEIIPAVPRVMDGRTQSLQIQADHNEIVTFTIAEINALLKEATPRTKLYVLLMLNCGMTQKDIADLQRSEVNWDSKRIKRKRSKTKSRQGVPTVSYRLWNETYRLLKAEAAADGDLVLVNANGKPLWQQKFDETGKCTKIDNVKTSYRRLCKQAKVNKPLKSLKKTSASLLRNNAKYASLESLFLGHAPRSMADKHYAATPQQLLDEAIGWLGSEYGVK